MIEDFHEQGGRKFLPSDFVSKIETDKVVHLIYGENGISHSVTNNNPFTN